MNYKPLTDSIRGKSSYGSYVAPMTTTTTEPLAPTTPETQQTTLPAQNQNIFQFLPTDISQSATGLVRDMFTGKAYQPAFSRMNEAMARSIQQNRAATGSQFAPMIGQGAAVRAQQGTEQAAMGMVAQNELDQAQMLAEGQMTGFEMAIKLEGQGREVFDRQLGALGTVMDDSLNAISAMGKDADPALVSVLARQYGNAYQARMAMLGQSISTADIDALTERLANGTTTLEDNEILGIGADVWDWWSEGAGGALADTLTGDAAQWAATFNDPNATEEARVDAATKLGDVIAAAYRAESGGTLTEEQRSLLDESGLGEFFQDTNPSWQAEFDALEHNLRVSMSGGTMTEQDAVEVISAINSGRQFDEVVSLGLEQIPGDILDYNYDSRDSSQGYRAWRLTNPMYTWATGMIASGNLVQGPNGRLYEVTGLWEPGTSKHDKLDAAYITFRDVVTGESFNYHGTHSYENTPRNWDDAKSIFPEGGYESTATGDWTRE